MITFLHLFSLVEGECLAIAGFRAKAISKYQCKLYQMNWSDETEFILTYKHCINKPATVNLFIRGFYGIDEINRDFNEKDKKWK